MFAAEAGKVGGGEVEAIEAELAGAAFHAAFEHRADDLGDGGLEAFGGIDGCDLGVACGVDGDVVEAAEAAAAQRGLRAAAAVGEDVITAGSHVGLLVIVMHLNTLPPPSGEWIE